MFETPTYILSSLKNHWSFSYPRLFLLLLSGLEAINFWPVSLCVLDTLDKRERWVANYIITNNKIKAKDVANHFKINLDTANNWIKKWTQKDFLKRLDDKQIRNVDYILTDKYIENLK